jgi:antirestriction protein
MLALGKKREDFEMQHVRIYAACLASYNAGTLHGEWIDAADTETMNDAIQAMLAASPEPGAEEYAIHDYEAPWAIDEYESLDDIASAVDSYETHGDAFVAALNLAPSVDVAVEMVEDRCLGAYDSWREMAECHVDEGLFGPVPDALANYIDYDAIGRDLEIECAGERVDGVLYVFGY